MTICTQMSATLQVRRPTLSARMATMVRRGWRRYWEWRARRATVLILSALNERTLHDIGINPSEIESCVYGPGNDRLRRYNNTWPWRPLAVSLGDGLKPPVAGEGSRRDNSGLPQRGRA